MNLNSVADLISCPICLDIPSGSIFLCQTGHSVCENCRKQITHCGICQSPMTDTKNFLAQDLAQKIKIPCKYASFGCPLEMAGAEREAHNNLCQFRSVICPLPLKTGDPCGKQFRMENYVQHILDDPLHSVRTISKISHKNYVIQSIPLEMTQKTKISQAELPPILHWKHGVVDFLLFTGTFNKMTPYWTIFAVSPLAENKEYWATITVRHPVTGIDWSFKSPCNSIRKSLVDITYSGMCLSINKNSFATIYRFDEKKKSIEWTLCVTFEDIQENTVNAKPTSTSSGIIPKNPAVPAVAQANANLISAMAHPSFPSGPPSSTASSSSSSLSKGVSTYKAPWPYSNDPHKVIHIGTFTNLKRKCGTGVCIITAPNQISLYTTCLFNYDVAKSQTDVEFEARNAIKVNQSFKTLFTNGCTVYFSSPKNLSGPGGAGSFQYVFNAQLKNFISSRTNFRFIIQDYNKNKLEIVAATLLLESKTLCNNVLNGSGIQEWTSNFAG